MSTTWWVIGVIALAATCYIHGHDVGQRGADRWWQAHETRACVMPETIECSDVNGEHVTTFSTASGSLDYTITPGTFQWSLSGYDSIAARKSMTPGNIACRYEVDSKDGEVDTSWLERGTVCHALAKERVSP